MINICSKLAWRCNLTKHSYRVIVPNRYATFTINDVLYETSDEAGTLLARFAKHVALERQKVCVQVPRTVKYSDYFPISDIRYFKKELEKTTVEQIAAVVIFAYTYRSNADPGKFAIILNELDRHALNNIKNMNFDTLLRTLYAFLFVIPNWITRLDFYSQAVQRSVAEFNQQEIQNKENFVQLCFYMGFSKKQTKNNVQSSFNLLLDKYLNKFINEISIIDLALVSNAAYKTSIVINNEEFNRRLLKEVLEISNTSNGNDALLVTFIKSMRFQRIHSSKVCEYIENICQNGNKLQQLQARGQIHLFAYLAENLWDSKRCTQPLIEAITDQLRISPKGNGCYSQIIRGKDISTFLWSCAQLNCNLSSAQFRTIENILFEKLDDGEFNYFCDQLVESCLSLWTLGYKSKKLLQSAIQLKSSTNNKSKQPKVDSRLAVLLSAAQIEEPSWCSTVAKDLKAFNLQAKIPPYLSNNQNIPYKTIIDELLKEKILASAQVSCPISGINIPGIYVELSLPAKSQLFLEFLTPSHTLNFSREPVAILRLKLRLLHSLGYKVKVVSITDTFKPECIKDAINEVDILTECVKDGSKTRVKA